MSTQELLSDSENDEDFAYKSDKEEDFSDSDDESRKLQRRIDAENKAVVQEEVKVDKDAMRKIYEEMKSGGVKETKPEPEATKEAAKDDTKETAPAPTVVPTIPTSSATNKVRKPKRAKKGSLLDAMNKPKKKLNTLEQSKADWGAFVDKEGIGHDLSQHNKDGYLEKRDFLDTH